MSFRQNLLSSKQQPLSARNSYTPEPFYRTGSNRGNESESTQSIAQGSLLNSSYMDHRHSSPYVEGKRNSGFLHPNLMSSNIFYSYEYPYKNEIPDPKQLSSIKVEKKDRSLNKSVILNRRVTMDEVERRSVSPAFNSSQFKSSLVELEETSSAGKKDDYLQTVQRNGPLSSRERLGGDPGQKRNSFSGARDRPYETERERERGEINETPLPVLDEEPEEVVPEPKKSKSTGTYGKYCPDCINKSQAERKKCHQMVEKHKDKQMMVEHAEVEKKKASYNHDKERARRVIEAKEAVESSSHRALTQYKQIHEKKRPEDKGGMVIDAIFDKQEERARQMREMKNSLRNQNLQDMMMNQSKKQEDRIERLTTEFTSLQLSGTYQNKYISQDTDVLGYLSKQMNETQNRRANHKEAEKRLEQELIDANLKAMEREKQMKKEKVETYKKMFTDQLTNTIRDKEATKEAERANNEKARLYATQAIEEHSNREKDRSQADQKNKAAYRQHLLEHQELAASYKQRHDQKKQYYEASLPLGKKSELHPCSGCNKLKEKHHLSHHKHV